MIGMHAASSNQAILHATLLAMEGTRSKGECIQPVVIIGGRRLCNGVRSTREGSAPKLENASILAACWLYDTVSSVAVTQP